jgi:Uma2 family endonuclease
MNAAFTPTPMRISTERYQKMVATGVLNCQDRVELIEGEILAMAPIGTRHASVTGRLFKRFVLAVGDIAIVRAANLVDLGQYSEPEPDLVVLKPQAEDYVPAHPQTLRQYLARQAALSGAACTHAWKQGPTAPGSGHTVKASSV